MDRYELGLALIGLLAILTAWLPLYVAPRALSVPMVIVAVGVGLFLLPLGLPTPSPIRHRYLIERLTEAGVLVSLMGAGLKLDRPMGWRSWKTT